MSFVPILQAVFSRNGGDPPQLMAKSAAFDDAWLDKLESILTDFGVRPAGVACPSAVFAHPLTKKLIAVVHVADRNANYDSQNPPLGFHVLVVPRIAYAEYVESPFALADQFPPDWSAQSVLPELELPKITPPIRTIEQVRSVLQRVKGTPLEEDVPIDEQKNLDPVERSESPALLGGVQVLVDGGSLVFERPAPDTDLLKALWTLLPNRTRAQLMPASFAFSNRIGFDVLVTPTPHAEELAGYTTEDQAADYPEGSYELNLQIAAESGNQRDLNGLFDRRSANDTWRLGITLLIAIVILVAGIRFLGTFNSARTPLEAEREIRHKQSRNAASAIIMSRPLETATLMHAVWKVNQKLKPK